ncbi:pyridoxamine 5'-phosphate oxidase family protein [Erythrobacter sp. SD-21]|uniref:pyridoxamine 5'-phosphate oxidase family protein n=1 Tax=Erythrobacter sp. SD-21 TaxID=161528 RepID=UPI000153EF7F|nr:pyridoxamine 5'-phosphate oxidase family protein [Erythrobacter sp. SD-21]EDL49229.1 hypothetical protein ED21_21154 [Erythrobacter sp. SD-21]
MSDRSVSQIAEKLKSIDIAMLVTKTGSEGAIAARPMSNNKDVSEEDGTSYHFATDDGRIDDDLKNSDQCGATYTSDEFYCAVQGTGKLHRDRAILERHWVKDLEAWFANGLDTEGLILIEVSPKRIDWWEGREEGQLTF